MDISIIIPTYGHLQDALKPCIESIIKYTSFDEFEIEIIVVANGCGDDGTKEYIKSLGGPFRLLWVDAPYGYAKAINFGLSYASGNFICLLNNDTVLLSQSRDLWLQMLLEPFEKNKSIGITSPIVAHSKEVEKDFAIFFCAMISRNVIDKIGYLDVRFNVGGSEDIDYCVRAQNVGYLIVQVPDTNTVINDSRISGGFPIYHVGELTVKELSDWNTIFENNQKLLCEKYNRHKINLVNAMFVDGWMTEKELEFLAKQASISKIVIEVGSWKGRSSRAIADNLPQDGVLYCIDTWNGSEYESIQHADAKLEQGDFIFKQFLNNNFDLICSGKIIPLRLNSSNAVSFFKEHNIFADFIFLDAGHTYSEVKIDIAMWRDVKKETGVISGHDYSNSWQGVMSAVNESFKNISVIKDTTIWMTLE